MPKFDLDAALEANPPPALPTKLHHPRIQQWAAQLLKLRDAGNAAITYPYIAEMLTRGARTEGIFGPKDSVSESSVRRYVKGLRRG